MSLRKKYVEPSDRVGLFSILDAAASQKLRIGFIGVLGNEVEGTLLLKSPTTFARQIVTRFEFTRENKVAPPIAYGGLEYLFK